MSIVSESRAGRWPASCTAAGVRPAVGDEYQFLLGRHVDVGMLSQACALATRWGVHPHDVLIAKGWLSEDDYYRALAEANELVFRANLTPNDVVPPVQASLRHCLAHGLLRERAGTRRFVLAPAHLRPSMLRTVLAQLGPYFSIATPRAVRAAVTHHFAPILTKGAVAALAMQRPDLSARGGAARWQCIALFAGLAAILAGLSIAPAETVRGLTLLLALLFVPVVALRAAAVYALLRRRNRRAASAAEPVPDASLPTYTILAPLFREAHMLPSLVAALTQLDWPVAKLDIKLILEAADHETRAAAHALSLPSHVEIVVVPDLAPRTKPKALNYALPLARGEYLVIYDAEDRPERDQLRRAYNTFRDGPPNLATVQAQLNIYNVRCSWLTRQFTLEYSALFDGLLPVLDRLRLPIPLGGTSNHFRVSALQWLKAWDPFNVTEDADLGTRLSRRGYRCAVIASTTYEEAPARFGSWLRQRTRWLKGFVQTWVVHMRRPSVLWRELGPRGFIAFQAMVGGTILSALIHPWFYMLALARLLGGNFLAPPSRLLDVPFWSIAWFVLVVGYGATMALAAIAVRRRGLPGLTWQVALMPLYWLLVSIAAYRALWQFVREPFKWEKTEHKGVQAAPSPAALRARLQERLARLDRLGAVRGNWPEQRRTIHGANSNAIHWLARLLRPAGATRSRTR